MKKSLLLLIILTGVFLVGCAPGETETVASPTIVEPTLVVNTPTSEIEVQPDDEIATQVPEPEPEIETEPEPQTGTLSGVVQDADGPMGEAVVRLQGTDVETLTAEDGTFSFPDLTLTVPISVTAWAEGYYVRAATAYLDFEPVVVDMELYHTVDNLEYRFASAETCGECHAAYPEWRADAHAQSATNRRFLSIYTGEDSQGNIPEVNYDASGRLLPPDPDSTYYGPGFKLDYPDRTGNCAACHTPTAAPLETTNTCGWSGCHTNTTAFYSDEVPYGINPAGAMDVGLEGITCDFCHKVGDVDLNPETRLPWSARPGISSYRIYRPGEGHDLFMGTFDDVPGFDTYLPLLEESEYCAPCHYGVFSGVVGSHEMAGGVTIYNSYGEWLDSPWSDPDTGLTCQNCHMPPVDYAYYVFPEKGGLQRDPNRIHNHLMPGVNDLDLMGNAVTMETTAEIVDDGLLVDVAITNDRTGHHVPTGSPYRHMILLITVEDSQGMVTPLKAGPVLPNWIGDYEGLPGTFFAKILQDDWTGDTPTASYWRDISLVEDTRIPAFETAENQFVFHTEGDGPYKIHVQLLYRRAYQQLMEWKSWDDPDIVMEESVIEINE